MVKKVLIVDDDQEMLLALKEGLDRYSEQFTTVIAENGLHAVEILKVEEIAVVVTDLKMPQMDGFALLTHIMENYPDISVIIMTAYSRPKMKAIAHRGGADGFIEKPFMIDDLAKKVMANLTKMAEGGTLHSVSSGIFLQFIEMEERTCTIRLLDKESEKQGVLFFRKGELIGARTGNLQGEIAAYEIFSWDKTSLSIQNDCLQKQRTIHNDLQAIVLDALLLKDEKDDQAANEKADGADGERADGPTDKKREETKAAPLTAQKSLRETPPRKTPVKIEAAVPKKPKSVPDNPVRKQPTAAEPALISRLEQSQSANPRMLKAADRVADIRRKLETEIGESFGLENVYQDASWDDLIDKLEKIGAIFNAGKLKTGHVDNGSATGFILIPGRETTVASVNPKSPMDNIIQVLSDG